MNRLKNDCYLRALLKQPIDYTPIWIMRQAGRYLPEYRTTRSISGSFLSLCKSPELSSEITLQPLRRFPLDAAILFSDILTIPDAMGLGLYFKSGEGPKFSNPISCIADIKKIGVPDPEHELQYVMNAIRQTCKELKNALPLIGFSGSPWTLATYMVEGGTSKKFTKIKKMMYREPIATHLLLNKLANSIIEYLNAQIKAGVHSVIIFDTWGGILTTNDYESFSLAYMKKIINNLIHENNGTRIPITLFTKNSGIWLEKIAETGCDSIALDWTIPISDAKYRVGRKVALQGNMDPSILYAKPERIREEVETILKNFGYTNSGGHVFNLGHGIHSDVEPESVRIFIETVHKISPKYHRST
ncbi:uroporphyrinogen decarboxylase [Candidatus Photodesmus katoptron]|uniref:Uroporphyrinogen decarboxylase n=1 Tax=Candidatus Photodesmus katoptron Akat1 TaxID=1236703 RepID=S3E1E6_9GAMM|nr:uroporphyrinogen decarboxylase [Candidatus Photodesmus katoptron]EPE38006.1 uroporphyrinogen decarboxylase [Candidatus Photodesmus katoptron Akat1]KEY90746.1 uroporphyrinogen decarboxylase [Candidatus Photodesmus katoptron]